MKKYPKYKPSGVEWIGEVPEGWEVKKLKYWIDYVIGGGTPSTNKEEYWGGDIPWVSPKDMKVDFINKTEDYITEEALNESATNLISERLVLVVVRSGILKHTLPVAINDCQVSLNQDMKAFKPTDEMNTSFLFWLFKGIGSEILSRCNRLGATVDSIDMEQLLNLKIVAPRLQEQTAIAAYLDRKAAQIDQSIAEKERLIELFREERQATINHAVTKGIRPGVKMKDSGVEWIGDVPEGWEVKKVKHVCNLQGRIGFKGYSKTDLVNEGEGVLTLGAKHINKRNELDLTSPEFLSWEKYYESPEIMVQQGHVIVTQRGSLGKVVVIDKEIGAATINPSMILLKNFSIDQHFFYYSLNGHFFVSWIEMVNNATAVPMISQEMLANLPIVCPDVAEQKEIVRYLIDKTAQIDTAISGIRQEIALLQEYRQALIFEAVTGKIDVRKNAQN